MKELRRNMRIVGTLVVVLFIALSAWFAFTVFEQGTIWASSSHNTRLSTSRTRRGDIRDRDGTLIATTDKDGKRVYLENASARRAMAVTLGDTAGMSGTGVEGYFSAQLLDLSDSIVERVTALVNGQKRMGSSLNLTVSEPLTTYITKQFPSGYRGAVCVLNYKTGEVLAMVSLPNYDPDGVGEDPVEDTAYLNRCLQGLYTPGSVFKLVTAAAALEADPAVVGKSFGCSGKWSFEGGSIVCAQKTAHGDASLEYAFKESCNVTFGKIAYQLGLKRMCAAAEKLGFNENFKMGDFILYNSQYPTYMSGSSALVWSGIGQDKVLVTPMHMTMITAAVANGGVMMKPYLVARSTTFSGVTSRTGTPEVYREVMDGAVAATLAQYMEATVESGTGTAARIRGVKVCGKTGSAETSNDKSVQTNSWFTGFVAEDKHPYAVSVVIEQGGSGGGKAAQLAGKALAKAIEVIG